MATYLRPIKHSSCLDGLVLSLPASVEDEQPEREVRVVHGQEGEGDEEVREEGQ